MAKRPVFVPNPNGPPYVKEVLVEFEWVAGMALSQKKKCVISLHQAAQRQGLSPLLETSTKSQEDVGIELSAFLLQFSHPVLGKISVESAFQGSKVFEHGGPYREFYAMPGREIKRDERLHNSGRLVHFDLAGEIWGLEPKTAFYDWLYLNAILQNPYLSTGAQNYLGFTDIEFNPEKSLNCQARSAALYVALVKAGKIETAMKTGESFINLVYIKTTPIAAAPRQENLF